MFLNEKCLHCTARFYIAKIYLRMWDNLPIFIPSVVKAILYDLKQVTINLKLYDGIRVNVDGKIPIHLGCPPLRAAVSSSGLSCVLSPLESIRRHRLRTVSACMQAWLICHPHHALFAMLHVNTLRLMSLLVFISPLIIEVHSFLPWLKM